MKKNHKQTVLQRLTIVILMILVINFIVPTYSYAGLGGVLMDPLVDIVCFIGDAVINFVQYTMTGEVEAGKLRSPFYGR